MGSYIRHFFPYTVASSETGGAPPVFVILRRETRVGVRIGRPSYPFPVRHGCTATTS
jgi:hypothetical protein